MAYKLIIAVLALLVGGVAAADEVDAVIDDPARAFTKQKKSPDKIVYGRLKLDSQGKVISTTYKEGVVTKATKVAVGVFDEKSKKWTPGEAIEGGIAADLFTEKGKVVRVRVTVGDDMTTVGQILVTKTDEKLAMADPEFDAILKYRGPQTNGAGGISYIRIELDDKGAVAKTFGLTTGRVTKDTKVAWGKFNEKEKEWEVGDDIPKALYSDIFGDFSAKTVYVRMTLQDDRRAFSQILVRQIGEQGKK